MQVINIEEENGNGEAGAGAAAAGDLEGTGLAVTAPVLDSSPDGAGGEPAAGEAHEPLEMVTLTEKFAYFDTLLRSLALIHSLISLALLVAYYHLKVRRFIL